MLEGRKDKLCEKIRTAEHDDKIYEWTWEHLKRLLNGERNIPSVSDFEKTISEGLVNGVSDISYGSNEQYRNHLFGQYKLYSEKIDQINSKRQTTHKVFLNINTALIALSGYCIINDSIQSKQILHDIIPCIGLGLNLLWFVFFPTYTILDIPRYRIIKKIEKLLPLNLYDAEQKAAKRIPKYLVLFDSEVLISLAFMIVYLIWYYIVNR